MPIIVGVFCLLPLLLGLAAEYLVCRFLRRKLWRLLPPAVVLALTALVAAGRLNVWESSQSPVTQLLFVPGLPALCAGPPGDLGAQKGGVRDVSASGPERGGPLPGRGRGI